MTCAGVMREKLSRVANVKKDAFFVVVFLFFMSTKVDEIMLFFFTHRGEKAYL
tara:strand:- start:44 stop:202 length:159 start_codon:yes stop_codon:yes gene_type:complete